MIVLSINFRMVFRVSPTSEGSLSSFPTKCRQGIDPKRISLKLTLRNKEHSGRNLVNFLGRFLIKLMKGHTHRLASQLLRPRPAELSTVRHQRT